MAGSAFKDKDVVEAMDHFVPILVDGDTEKGVTSKYEVSGYPHVLFATVKGEEVRRVRGAVPTSQFLSDVESAKKKAKQGKGSKAYRALVKADQELSKALAKGKAKAILAAVEKAEATELEHRLVERARAARTKLLAEAKAELDAAAKLVEAGKVDEARKTFRRLFLDLKGTEVSDAAKEWLAKTAEATEK